MNDEFAPEDNYAMNKPCTLCGHDKDCKHLELYVIGSEGVFACLSCRITLTHVAKGILTAASVARRNGYKAAMTVARAKEAPTIHIYTP